MCHELQELHVFKSLTDVNLRGVFNGYRFLACNHDTYAVFDTELRCAFATAQALEDACMMHLTACDYICLPSIWPCALAATPLHGRIQP